MLTQMIFPLKSKNLKLLGERQQMCYYKGTVKGLMQLEESKRKISFIPVLEKEIIFGKAIRGFSGGDQGVGRKGCRTPEKTSRLNQWHRTHLRLRLEQDTRETSPVLPVPRLDSASLQITAVYNTGRSIIIITEL